MVSVAVSKLGCSDLAFTELGAKVDGSYYHDELLSNNLLPDIWRITADTFVFQQDNASAHHTRKTLAFL